MSFSVINKSFRAINLSFENDKMLLLFEDGRELSVPLEWFPTLRNASWNQLKKWRFIGQGEGIHWEELNEDISIEKVLI